MDNLAIQLKVILGFLGLIQTAKLRDISISNTFRGINVLDVKSSVLVQTRSVAEFFKVVIQLNLTLNIIIANKFFKNVASRIKRKGITQFFQFS